MCMWSFGPLVMGSVMHGSQMNMKLGSSPGTKSQIWDLQKKTENWNVTIPQPQGLEKKDSQPKSSQANIPTFCSLLQGLGCRA